MNLVRKIKISKLVDNTLSETEKEIIDFINSKLKNLIPFIWDIKPHSIYYMNSNGLVVLEQDNKNEVLWVRYIDLWVVLEEQYSIEYSDIQILIKYMVEQAFKQKVSTPAQNLPSCHLVVEQAFKQKVSTPSGVPAYPNGLVEQAFKQKVSTPVLSAVRVTKLVEQAFKQKVSTPKAIFKRSVLPVEQAFKQKVSTPLIDADGNELAVEQAFKQSVSKL